MTNKELIQHFYTCFSQKDYKGMQACYADQAVFSDAVFKNLNSDEVKAMWEMLCLSGKDLRLEFSNIQETADGGSAHWDAYYTFSLTGNKVINRIDAVFKIENGKITSHTDHFNFYRWASQALGVNGKLLGWTSLVKNKVRSNARKNLEKFMDSKKQAS